MVENPYGMFSREDAPISLKFLYVVEWQELNFLLNSAGKAFSLISLINETYEPRCEKTGLRGFRPGLT